MSTLQCLRTLVRKELEIQQLQGLWENAKHSFDSDQYPNAVEELTAAVTEIEENVLAVTLLKRAVAFSHQGNLQDGIKDAYRAIELAPDFLQGYLLAGSLLQLANERVKAIAIYRKGINALSGRCLGRDQLTIAEKSVKDQIEQENTVLLQKLPFELLGYIFGDLLAFNDRLQCMYTCHAWKDFLLESILQETNRVVLGSMPKAYMTRLLTPSSIRHPMDLCTRSVQVSILPTTSTGVLKHALRLLSQAYWHGRIEILDICVNLYYMSEEAIMFDRVLRQNTESLKRVTVCGSKSTVLAMRTLDTCAQLSHLVIAPYSSNLTYDYSTVTTHSKKRVTSNTSTIRGPNIQTTEDLAAAAATAAVTAHSAMASSDSQCALQFQIQLQQLKMPSHLKADHSALKRLEIFEMNMHFFINLRFWTQLPNLEQVIIKNPEHRAADLQTLVQYITQSCPKLKIFRYGANWEDSFCYKNDIASNVDTTEEQGQGLYEFAIRISNHHMATNLSRSLVLPTLRSANLICGMRVLTVLNLQMEVFGTSELQTLTNIYLPCLKDFRIHQYFRASESIILQEHVQNVSENFPALEKIVLDNVDTNGDALFEFSKAQKLHYAHLSVLTTTFAIPRRRRMFLMEEQTTVRVNRRNARNARNAYTSFINNCINLTEVCLFGPELKDSDLYTLVANNRSLSSINLIGCISLTSDGIISAFSCRRGDALSVYPSTIQQITLAYFEIRSMGHVVSTLTKLPNLKKLTLVSSWILPDPHGIDLASCIQCCPSRNTPLKVYRLNDLAEHEGLLFEWMPDQKALLKRSVSSVTIVRPFIHIL